MNWTDERVEQLKKLWAEGLSASQIAAQLGGVSRNAVIGKVHRLKLSGRGRATGTPTRQKKAPRTNQPAAKAGGRPASMSGAGRSPVMTSGANALKIDFESDPVHEAEIRPVRQPMVVPVSRRLALTELNERTCKWPVGDPLAEDFHFCGWDSAESGPYCTYHARVAYQPVSERRKRA